MSYVIDTLYHFPITIPDATPTQDGVMTKAQAAKLAGLSDTIVAFQYTVQPGDNDDFIVTIPVGKRPVDGNYTAVMVIQSGPILTGYQIPFADQTAVQFRVITDATFDVGTLLGFTVTAF